MFITTLLDPVIYWANKKVYITIAQIIYNFITVF